MSHGQRLLVVPNDLRDAARFFERYGNEFESITSVLRQEWRALEGSSEYAAEAVVAAACERAFGELLRSQLICAEVAHALRLTADTLEEADRRAAALIRVDRGNGGGGSVPVPPPWSGGGSAPGGSSGGGGGGFVDFVGNEGESIQDRVESAINDFKLLTTLHLLYTPDALTLKKVGGREYLSFRPADSLISPRFLGIDGGVAKNSKDFVKRFEEIELSGLRTVGRPLSVIDKATPLIGALETLGNQGLSPAILPHLADFGLQFVKRVDVFSGSVVGAYQALTEQKYEGKREAAVIVKTLSPVISTGAGIVVGAVLTALCPVGAPLWFTLATAGTKVVASYLVDKAIEKHEDTIIDFIDTGLDRASSSIKASVDRTTARIVEDIDQAGRALPNVTQWLGRIGALPNLAR